ncbi:MULTISPECIES: type II toxin-antitoxin system HicA family toxin [Okeania]|uniref:type II toxin-antitoxin system HicA family toxin n=1 Tax=Okeania TaxID=1458928 RepID=UPI001EFFF66E|nr:MULTISPECIES: type II toxin-antitoxin system HicA family toxin [Okeania]
MPRLPRISSKEAIRTLERLGFQQVRQTGSHASKNPYQMEKLFVSCHCITN